MYSNPPTQGARIVATVMDSPELYRAWVAELKVPNRARRRP
jgi:aspartate/tyrosine/aromatic aminotransferase